MGGEELERDSTAFQRVDFVVRVGTTKTGSDGSTTRR